MSQKQLDRQASIPPPSNPVPTLHTQGTFPLDRTSQAMQNSVKCRFCDYTAINSINLEYHMLSKHDLLDDAGVHDLAHMRDDYTKETLHSGSSDKSGLSRERSIDSGLPTLQCISSKGAKCLRTSQSPTRLRQRLQIAVQQDNDIAQNEKDLSPVDQEAATVHPGSSSNVQLTASSPTRTSPRRVSLGRPCTSAMACPGTASSMSILRPETAAPTQATKQTDPAGEKSPDQYLHVERSPTDATVRIFTIFL